MKSRAFAASCVAAAFGVLSIATPGVARAAVVPALDYYEILQLNARFNHALDNPEDHGNSFAQLFTADGVFVDPAGSTHQGRDQLAAYAREDADSQKGPLNEVHYVTNITMEATPAGMRSKGYAFVAATPPGQGDRRAFTDVGQYWDDLVRTADGWRIRKRTFVRPGAGAPAMAAAAPSPSPPPSMPHPLTAQDYADIYQLYALYGYTFDSGADQGYQWANLMTPDAIWANAGTPLDFLKGRDAAAAFAYGALRPEGDFLTLTRGPVPAKNPLGVDHILTEILLDPTAEGVASRVYRLRGFIGANGQPTLNLGAVYQVLLVRTSDGWRFKENWYLPPDAPVPPAANRFMPGQPDAMGPARGYRGTVAPLTLDAEDDADIRRLYARYEQALDSGGESGHALARLFTPDGVLLDTWANTLYQGSEKLAEFARGTANDAKGPTSVNHFDWNIKIERGPQGVTGKAYTMTARTPERGKPLVMINGGQYWDDLVKTADGWRIKKRVFFRSSQVPLPQVTPQAR